MQDAAAANAEVVNGGSTIERVLAATGAAGIIGGSVAVWYFDPKTAGFFPVCPLYALTGFACPGCGLTRGFHALFHGDILTALDYNALIPLFGLLLIFAVVTMVHYSLRGRRLSVNLFNSSALWVFFVLLLVFGVLRNVPVYPFTILFP